MRTFPPAVCCSTFGSEFRRRFSEQLTAFLDINRGNRFASDEIVATAPGAKSAMIRAKIQRDGILLRIEWETRNQQF